MNIFPNAASISSLLGIMLPFYKLKAKWSFYNDTSAQVPSATPTNNLPAQPVHRASRAAAVFWDMHVFINQLIQYEISFECDFSLGMNFRFLFSYFAAWHEVKQNKCRNTPPKIANTY